MEVPCWWSPHFNTYQFPIEWPNSESWGGDEKQSFRRQVFQGRHESRQLPGRVRRRIHGRQHLAHPSGDAQLAARGEERLGKELRGITRRPPRTPRRMECC